MIRHRLIDEQWDLIKDFFPEPKTKGRPPVDPRDMIDGIFWRLKTGTPWRDVPEEFGKWSTVYKHFDLWSSDGTLDKIQQALLTRIVDEGGIDEELWCVDGSIVRAARCAAGGGKNKDPNEPENHALGRSCGGFSTKIHMTCDASGVPIHFKLSPGQAHENQTLESLLNEIDDQMRTGNGEVVPWPQYIAGDKGYRSNSNDEMFLDMDVTPVIPTKRNEDPADRQVDFDREKYRDRNIIERLFGWLKECRAVFSRFEKTAINYAGMVKLAFIQRYFRIIGKMSL